jgi:PDZ domain-containing secreted protein
MIIDYICIEEDFDSEFVAGTGSIAKDYILKVRFK